MILRHPSAIEPVCVTIYVAILPRSQTGLVPRYIFRLFVVHHQITLGWRWYHSELS